MERLGAVNPVECSFGAPLKDVIDKAIVEIRASADRMDAVERAMRIEADVPYDVAERLVNILYDTAARDPHEHARSHSVPVVEALQFYGTEFRRAHDPNHWVRMAAREAEQMLQAGMSPYFTDARFPNEIEGLAHMGSLSLRLDIDPEEQKRRLQQRDGYIPSEAALTHPSETSLDDYDAFDIRVLSDGVDATVDAILEQL